MHVRVAVPEPCRVVWSSVQSIPVGAEMESVMVLVKPLTEVMVIVEVVDWPVGVEVGCVESILMSELRKVNVVMACGVLEPLVPVMITVKVPACPEWQANVAVVGVEARVMLAGLIAEQASPVGNGVSESETVPVNPLTGARVIVDVAVSPGSLAAGVFADIVKSVNVNVAVLECDRDPPTPVTVRV